MAQVSDGHLGADVGWEGRGRRGVGCANARLCDHAPSRGHLQVGDTSAKTWGLFRFGRDRDMAGSIDGVGQGKCLRVSMRRKRDAPAAAT